MRERTLSPGVAYCNCKLFDASGPGFRVIAVGVRSSLPRRKRAFTAGHAHLLADCSCGRGPPPGFMNMLKLAQAEPLHSPHAAVNTKAPDATRPAAGLAGKGMCASAVCGQQNIGQERPVSKGSVFAPKYRANFLCAEGAPAKDRHPEQAGRVVRETPPISQAAGPRDVKWRRWTACRRSSA